MFGRKKTPAQIIPPQPRISKGQPLSLVDRYLERGLHHYQNQRYAEAIADFDEAVHLAPKDAELYVTRGSVLAEKEDYDEAMKDLQHALERDPSQWLAHYVLGMIALRRNQYEEAIKKFSDAQRIVPHRPEVFLRGPLLIIIMGM
jgi:tetratricopeptide (TPR) repeat protein